MPAAGLVLQMSPRGHRAPPAAPSAPRGSLRGRPRFPMPRLATASLCGAACAPVRLPASPAAAAVLALPPPPAPALCHPTGRRRPAPPHLPPPRTPAGRPGPAAPAECDHRRLRESGHSGGAGGRRGERRGERLAGLGAVAGLSRGGGDRRVAPRQPWDVLNPPPAAKELLQTECLWCRRWWHRAPGDGGTALAVLIVAVGIPLLPHPGHRGTSRPAVALVTVCRRLPLPEGPSVCRDPV